MEVKEITDANVNDIITNNKKLVIDCYAPWCGPCRMLSPIIDELASERGEVTFYKLNVDDNEKTALKYGIMSIPTLLIFENGELKNKSVGLKSKDEIIALIK